MHAGFFFAENIKVKSLVEFVLFVLWTRFFASTTEMIV